MSFSLFLEHSSLFLSFYSTPLIHLKVRLPSRYLRSQFHFRFMISSSALSGLSVASFSSSFLRFLSPPPPPSPASFLLLPPLPLSSSFPLLFSSSFSPALISGFLKFLLLPSSPDFFSFFLLFFSFAPLH